MPANPRNGRPYRRLCAMQKALGLPCWLCGHDIDPTLDPRDARVVKRLITQKRTRVASPAARVSAEEIQTTAFDRAKRLRVTRQEPVKRAAARQPRAHEGRQRLRKARARDRLTECLLEVARIVRVARDACDGFFHRRHQIAFAGDGAAHLIFQRRGASIPEEGPAVDAIEDRRHVAPLGGSRTAHIARRRGRGRRRAPAAGGGHVSLAAHGIRVGLPPGWEGRIYRRPDVAAQPVVHAANVALAPDDGDFATRTAELMPVDGALIVMVEYDPVLAGTAQFASTGVPPLLADFSRANGAHPGIVNVAMCDGSVRGVSPGVSPTTWTAAQLPADGQVPGSDW